MLETNTLKGNTIISKWTQYLLFVVLEINLLIKEDHISLCNKSFTHNVVVKKKL